MTILITGANRGIGLALAELEASQGEQVIATSRTPVENITAGIRWETLEVTDPESHQSLAK